MQTTNSSARQPRSNSNRRLVASVLVAGAIAVGSHGPPARAQQPTFRAGVDLLTIDVNATDRDGRPIRDLRAEDFTVTIGGQPRTVEAARFYGTTTDAVEAAAAAPGAPAAPADVHRPSDAPARTVVFVVDRDSLKPGNELAMLRTTSLVFDGLSPADAVGLVGIPVGGIDLTREHERVKTALPMMTGTRPRPVAVGRERSISWDEAVAYERQDSRIIKEVVERECYLTPSMGIGLTNPCPEDLKIQAREFLQTGRSQALSTLSRLGMLVDQLATIRGPKHIILLSGGLGFDPELLLHYNTFQRRAAAANVVIHAVHLDQPVADATDRLRVTSASGGNDMITGLGNLTAMTGGSLFLGAGKAEGVFARIRDQVGNFYQLAVESRAEDAIGTRDLKVTVNRPGVSTRARRELPPATPATAAPTTDALAQLLQQPTDFAQLPTAVATYTTRGTDETRLRVLISGEVGARPAVPAADFGFVVLREGNVVATGRQHIEASDAPPQIMTMAALLLPGKYRLRYATSGADGRASASDIPLTVGLRAAGDFQVSDLLVGVADQGRMQPRSRVGRATSLIAMLELMSADPEKLAQARVTLELIPAGTAEPVMRLLMAAKGDPGTPLLLNQAAIDTSRLAPGRYTAVATPVLNDQPLGRISRVFDVE